MIPIKLSHRVSIVDIEIKIEIKINNSHLKFNVDFFLWRPVGPKQFEIKGGCLFVSQFVVS